MGSTVIENLSAKRLSIFLLVLIFSQAAFFLIGGLVAPSPTISSTALAKNCLDPNHTAKLFYPEGAGACHTVDLRKAKDLHSYERLMNDIVFVFQLPTSKAEKTVGYSRWHQNLIGVLKMGIIYQRDLTMEPATIITMFATIGYKNKGDQYMEWKSYTSSVVTRVHHCDFKSKREGFRYNCSVVYLFELGSTHHDYYLLNIRIPVHKRKHINTGLGRIEDMYLISVTQNTKFSKLWISMKTIFFPLIMGVLIWFWKRVHRLRRAPVLLEKMLIFLGCSLALLNAPFEYLTLVFDVPYMLILDDLKHGIFYVALLTFWLVFVREHLMLSKPEHRNWKAYWKYFISVAFLCLCLLFLDVGERVLQLSNPFYSTWATELGFNLATTAIIAAALAGLFYVIFLCYLIWQAFNNITVKRGCLSCMPAAKKQQYQGMIFRFNFLVMSTVLCAGMTAIAYVLDQVSEDQWKWNDKGRIKHTSAFFTGLYGLWNIYVFAGLILYAPSEKRWRPEPGFQDGNEMERSRFPVDIGKASVVSALVEKEALN